MRRDVAAFLRAKIKQHLALCTLEQVETFERIYGVVDFIDVNRLEDALGLCERTNKKFGRWPDFLLLTW